MSWLPLSNEQQAVYEEIVKGNHVVVNACAGSGKSTTILGIVQRQPHRRVLQITYNSMLRKEIQEKVKRLGIQNLEVHTFHSLCVKYYHRDGFTDRVMKQVVQADLIPLADIPPIDMLVLDEAQDMNLLYYQLIVKYIRNGAPKTTGPGHGWQCMILGDERQGLYEFKGSDTRFLTQASEIWCNIPGIACAPIIEKSLRVSYRITRPMATFVNDLLLGEERLEAVRDGDPVTFVIYDSEYTLKKVLKVELTKILQEGGKPGDIFILGASIRWAAKRWPVHIRQIENFLVEEMGIPCYVPMFEDAALSNDQASEGKVVFSTFHTVKGRQRPYVFVFGFDGGYFKKYQRRITKDTCPNTLYVATTRASKRLYLLESCEGSGKAGGSGPLPCLKETHAEMKQRTQIVSYKGNQPVPAGSSEEANPAQKSRPISVWPSLVLRFVSESKLEILTEEIMNLFTKRAEPMEEEQLEEITTVVETENGFFEEVSDLNGLAIPSLCYQQLNPSWIQLEQNEIYQNIQYILESKPQQHSFVRKWMKTLPTECNSINTCLLLANLYIALKEELYFKLQQINSYSWLTEEMLQPYIERMREEIGDDVVNVADISRELNLFSEDRAYAEEEQKTLNDALQPILGETNYEFWGVVDCVTDTKLLEWKCVSTLTIEHFVQLLFYAWIWEHLNESKTYHLYNIRTGESYELTATREDMTRVVANVLKTKFEETETEPCVDFVAMCSNSVKSM